MVLDALIANFLW